VALESRQTIGRMLVIVHNMQYSDASRRHRLKKHCHRLVVFMNRFVISDMSYIIE